MKDVIKGWAWRFAPSYMADRVLRHNVGLERAGNFNTWAVIERVEAGPFAGLVYPPEVRRWIPGATMRRDGAYERPLAEYIAGTAPDAEQFVDIGAADGYYLVGVARLGVPSIGYESSRLHRRNVRRTARANDARVTIHGHCRRFPTLTRRSLVLMDVEGAEDELVDADAVAQAARSGSTVVVEVHEYERPGVTDRVSQRFAATHERSFIEGDIEPGRHDAPRWAVFTPR